MERFPRNTGEHNTTSANNSAAAEGSKGRQRSRVTNGSALLPGVDGRSAWVRRCKDIIEAHLSDLGGEDNTSVAERSLVRRAAVITTGWRRGLPPPATRIPVSSISISALRATCAGC